MEFYKQKGYTQQKENNWAKIGCSNVVVSSSDWNEHQVYNLLHFVFCSFADISYTLLDCSYMLYTVIHCTFGGICYTPLYTVLLQASVIHRYTLYFFRHLLYTVLLEASVIHRYTLYFCRHLLYTVIHCTFAGICYTLSPLERGQPSSQLKMSGMQEDMLVIRVFGRHEMWMVWTYGKLVS